MRRNATRRPVLPILGTGLILAGLATTSHPATTARAAAAGPALTFSHQVVVDHQRPGFEPDLKVAPDGTLYGSVPFGFSTTESFVWASRDNSNSYQLTPGTFVAGAGKPATCVGGGDTDLLVDPGGELYLSDLQGLTNLSQSASADGGKTWATNCAGAPNTPVDRMWLTSTGSLKTADLNLYQDYDAVNSSASGGNQLVETVSHDGTTFQPVIDANFPNPNCVGGGAINCVTNNEGISGNQVVQFIDSTHSNLFISHNDTTGAQILVSAGQTAPSAAFPTLTQATWTDSAVLNKNLCGADATCINSAGAPDGIAGENFASIAQDKAGYLYVTFTWAPYDNSGSTPVQASPEAIYVVHSLQPATMADPSKVTWSNAQLVSGSQATPGTNVFPWITAGTDGRVAVAWYHTDTSNQAGAFGAALLTSAEWTVQLGQSLNAHDANPAYSVSPVTEHPIKYGQICTSGLACVSGGDRSLGDFLQVVTDSTGAALVTYVDDTSADTANGENAGTVNVSRQISGPGLNSAGTVSQGTGPGVPFDIVSDPVGDAFWSANGAYTPAGDNLDVIGSSLTDGPAGSNTLIGKINVKSLASLAVSPTVGGPDASWILRWTYVTPGQTGNGHIYYAGMDNAAGGTPTFFVGDTQCIPLTGNPAEHCKYFTYPQTTTLTPTQGSYDAATGVITFNIPLAAVGNPALNDTLYSVTAFSATSLVAPQSSTTLFHLIDATSPYDHVIATAPVSTPEAPLTAGLIGAGLAALAFAMVRRRRARIAGSITAG